MIIRKALVALASAGMVFGSTAAVAAPAVDSLRASSPVGESEQLGAWSWILAVVILAGVIGVVASDGDEEVPVSP